MGMWRAVCVCVHGCVHTCGNEYVDMYTFAFVHMGTHGAVGMSERVHVFVYISTYRHLCMHVCMSRYTCICVAYCIYKYISQRSSEAFSLASRVIILVLTFLWYFLDLAV